MGVAELTRNAVDVLPAGELERKLAKGRPLRVKLGIDVTSPDIHVGRGIPLQRLRAFQDEGHVAVLIIGDYTTRIGDPSGRSSERPMLSDAEIDRNAQEYLAQAGVILRTDPELLEVRYNGEWPAGLAFAHGIRPTRPPTRPRPARAGDLPDRHHAGRRGRGEARARARHRAALAWGGGRAGGRGALHARRAGGTRARPDSDI